MSDGQQTTRRQEPTVTETFALLGQAPEREFSFDTSFDFARNNFFNRVRTNAEYLAGKPVLAEQMLSVQTPPEVLARELFRTLGIEISEEVQEHLDKQRDDFDKLIATEETEQIQDMVVNNLARNAIVHQGFDALRDYLDSQHGIIYDDLWVQAHTYGHFVVAQAVIETQANPSTGLHS